MPATPFSPLAAIEPRLRWLLPADLYAAAWVDPAPPNLVRVFEHLRTLQHILNDYVPRQVLDSPPSPGEIRHTWEEGTLMFTDLAGFTPLLEANAARGRAGAETLLGVLNAYFTAMIEIISKSGGNLLEFTGDAMLAQFPADARRRDPAQAVRAGLRMQRAMAPWSRIETPQGPLSLGMRVGIHTGRFFTADIGSPRRMEHVLLGEAVHWTKLAEGAGRVGRVCLTEAARARVGTQFGFEQAEAGYALVRDDAEVHQLDEYDITPSRRRAARSLLMDRSVAGLVGVIEQSVAGAEPLASYLPQPILTLLVESAARRQIRPEFPELTVVFVNLGGPSEAVDRALPGEEGRVIVGISRAFALINAAVEARGGVLKNLTYDRVGSDILIYFGVPAAHTDDPLRAADAALAIRAAIAKLPPLTAGGAQMALTCQIGIARGPAFAAEIGEPRGRREFNVLGDSVNTAARLMSRAAPGQILLTEAVHALVASQRTCTSIGPLALKGKAAPRQFLR